MTGLRAVVDPDRISRCSSCAAPIRWVHTENGRAMPLDAEPVDEGNVVYVGRPSTNARGVTRPTVRVEPTPPMFPDGEDRFVSHFSTCPNADQHRHTRGDR